MREIKFRFWIKKLKEMCSWELVKKECNRLSILELDGYVPMQYTGMKDKQGAEIYEGDVIRGNLKQNSLETMGQIVFDDSCASFTNQNEAGNTLLDEINQIEVLGNIYENPELLGG